MDALLSSGSFVHEVGNLVGGSVRFGSDLLYQLQAADQILLEVVHAFRHVGCFIFLKEVVDEEEVRLRTRKLLETDLQLFPRLLLHFDRVNFFKVLFLHHPYLFSDFFLLLLYKPF